MIVSNVTGKWLQLLLWTFKHRRAMAVMSFTRWQHPAVGTGRDLKLWFWHHSRLTNVWTEYCTVTEQRKLADITFTILCKCMKNLKVMNAGKTGCSNCRSVVRCKNIWPTCSSDGQITNEILGLNQNQQLWWI